MHKGINPNKVAYFYMGIYPEFEIKVTNSINETPYNQPFAVSNILKHSTGEIDGQ
jgi:hypothetical protein